MTIELTKKLAERVASLPHGTSFWLAITGPPGAGKSTLSAAIIDYVSQLDAAIPSVVIPMDGYHFYRSELDTMPDAANARRRRGAPFTFNAQRFVDEVSVAKRNRKGVFPSFQHGTGDPVENAIRLTGEHRLVIVEGNYLLLDEAPWSRLESIFDESWFLDTPLDVIRERLKSRMLATGRSEEEANLRIETNDLPNARLVIERCRPRATQWL